MRALPRKALVGFALAVALTFAGAGCTREGGEPVSRFGEYRGYSQATYDGYVRRSGYLPLRDGTLLAYDLLLPTRDGHPASEPLPVLLTITPYLRVVKIVDAGRVLGAELFELSWLERAFLRIRARTRPDGHLLDQVFRTPWLERLIRHGYAVVAVERAGTGASFGRTHPSWEVAAREADQVLDWIAAQAWSDGNVGMFGDSYEAMTQYAAASTGNPHLKAILPCSASFDFYDGLIYPGGVFNRGFTAHLPRALATLETMVVEVDDDPGGVLLAKALEARRQRTLGRVSGEAFRRAPTRDARLSEGPRLWEQASLYTLLDRIRRAGVPVYNLNGWHDLFARDTFLWHVNLKSPRRIHVRPLHHRDMNESGPDLDLGAEAHRWFDAWLKGIDNGILREPPVRYWVMGADDDRAWRTAHRWPPPEARPLRLYLDGGALREDPPAPVPAHDTYRVDYTTTSGFDSRWNTIRGSGTYADMRANDVKDAPDLDLFAWLEEVAPDGSSRYVTEGNLRASHRALAEPPFDNLGLPWQRSHAGDLAPLPPGEPVALAFDLQPTSKLFRRGHRIRVAIAGADADNFETPHLDPPPLIHVLRGAHHSSFIELPTLPVS
jgi:putative CocE/NonD family hydrolase